MSGTAQNLLASVVLDVTGPLPATEAEVHEIAGIVESAVQSLSYSLHEAIGETRGLTFTVREQ